MNFVKTLVMTLYLKEHCYDIFRYFGVSVSEDNKRLPSICWLSKLNKKPTKGRFIFAAVI